MKPQRKLLLAGGAVFCLGMFIMLILQVGDRLSTWAVGLIFLVCLLAGILFWAGMELFLKVAIKYTGADKLPPRQLTKQQRLISLASVPFVAVPLYYTIIQEFAYMWPVLASSFVHFLVMSPLGSQDFKPSIVFFRAALSAVLGAAVCVAVYTYFVAGPPFAVSNHTLAVAVTCAVAFAISNVLSLYARRPNPAFQRTASGGR